MSDLLASSSVPPTQPRKPIVVHQPGNKKRSNPSSQSTSQQPRRKKAATTTSSTDEIPGLPGFSTTDILWVEPAAGFGNPLPLKDIPEGVTKVFYKWFQWGREDKVGYTLIERNEQKYWADPAAIHILDSCKMVKITDTHFFFLVKKQKKALKYGFLAKVPLGAEQRERLSQMIAECNSKTDAEEEEDHTTVAAAARTIQEEEENQEDTLPAADGSLDYTTFDPEKGTFIN